MAFHHTNELENQKHPTRRELLKYGLCGGLTASLSNSLWFRACGAQHRTKKTNVLVISIDTLRADHLSCYGYWHKTTPYIDQLASQGHCFARAYTTMPTTLPAHLSMCTSLYPTQLSVCRNGETVPQGVTTLAEILQSSGYKTAVFASSSVLGKRYQFNRGFETAKQKESSADVALDNTLEWLKSYDGEAPFFIFTHFRDPHTFYHSPARFRVKLDAPDRKEPPERSFVRNPKVFSPAAIRKIISAYDAEIACADWAVGQLLGELKRRRLDENTLVILVSDHGESMDELLKRYQYVFDHGEFLYHHQLHVPMIVRMPTEDGNLKGAVHHDPVSIIDITPTVLDMLSIEPRGPMEGSSLLPVLQGNKRTPRLIFSERRSFQSHPRPFLKGRQWSIIDDQWHLIVSMGQGSELFNVIDDPDENSNLQDKKEVIQSLTEKLNRKVAKLKPMFGTSVFEKDEAALEKLRSLGYVR